MTTIDYGSTPYSKLKRQQLLTLTYALEDMRDRAIERYETAEAALERVRELHRPVDVEPSDTICGECSFRLPNGRFFGRLEEYPCATIRALDGEATDA